MNWFKFFKTTPDKASSILYDEKTFYQAFFKDIKNAQSEVIIESPFISAKRAEKFYLIFTRILDRGTKVLIITRDPSDLDSESRDIATNEIMHMADMGIDVKLVKGNHHRKIVIIDRKIIYEGSLNILSQNNSIELMRRFDSSKIANELIKFIKLKV